jgi:hypothetical protein
MKTKFEQACENQGYDPDKIMPDFSMYPEKHREALASLAELLIMADDANKDEEGKDWEADWNDNDQQKWRVWVDMEEHKKNNPSGFRFDGAYYGCTTACANLGSRLSFRNEKIAKKFFEDNKDHYKKIMTIPKTK